MTPFTRIHAAVLLTGAFTAGALHADTIHVPDDFPTIQQAIDAATDGDEIVLANGMHSGDGNKELDFQSKTITLRSETGDRDQCVIDCESVGRFANFGLDDIVAVRSITVENGNPGTAPGGAALVGGGSTVSFIDCEFRGCVAMRGGALFAFGANLTIDGCYLTGNSSLEGFGGGAVRVNESVLTCTDSWFEGNTTTDAGGAGMLAADVDPASVISRCRFTGNVADGAGGGLALTGDGAPLVADCLFEHNVASQGGGLLVRNSPVGARIENVVFEANDAWFGGGVSIDGASVREFVNCLLVENRALVLASAGDPPASGGMDVFDSSSVTLIGCTFARNSSEEFGGALTSSDNAFARLVDCVLWDDHAPTGSEIQIGYPGVGGGTVTVSYSDIADGESGVSILAGTLNWGDGNIDSDPLFVDPDGGDYRLDAGSPCIDAGDNDPVTTEEDLGGDPRYRDDPDTPDTGNGRPPLVDMGSYEYQGGFCPADLDGSGAVDFGDILRLLTEWGPCAGDCPEDLDDSGAVDFGDILVVLSSWGPCTCGACRLTDDCLDAALARDGSHGFDTREASGDGPGLPESCDEGRGLMFRRDVWLRYVASCDGVATASVCDSTFDTRLAVYEHSDAECPGALLACSDDVCGDDGTRSTVDFPVESGRSYLVRVGGHFAAGEGSLVIDCAE